MNTYSFFFFFFFLKQGEWDFPSGPEPSNAGDVGPITVQELNPTCLGATKPEPQLLSPSTLEPGYTTRKACMTQWRLSTAKKWKMDLKKKAKRAKSCLSTEFQFFKIKKSSTYWLHNVYELNTTELYTLKWSEWCCVYFATIKKIQII